MNWFQANAVALLALAVTAWLAVVLIRALVISRRRQRPTNEIEHFTRTEKIRRDVQRRIAERKANPPAASSPPQPAATPGWGRIPPIDPFGGRGRRMWDRVRRWFSDRP